MAASTALNDAEPEIELLQAQAKDSDKVRSLALLTRKGSYVGCALMFLATTVALAVTSAGAPYGGPRATLRYSAVDTGSPTAEESAHRYEEVGQIRNQIAIGKSATLELSPSAESNCRRLSMPIATAPYSNIDVHGTVAC